MGVYIKGMEMPKSCFTCQMLEGEPSDGLCHAANKWLDDDEFFLWYQYPEGDIDDSKPTNCPLVPVPPHGRLIDANALWHTIKIMDEADDIDIEAVTVAILYAPTVIPASAEDKNVPTKQKGGEANTD